MIQSAVGGATVTYAYDGDGKRVKKDQTNGSTYDKLYWYGLGADPLEESDLAGTATADYIFFNGKRAARRDLPGGAVHYYFANHLGSANVVTNAAGTTIEDESDYYPFGGERAITSADPNQYKFTGKERDLESGLDFFGARYYSSQYARFMIPDWAASPTAVPYADFGDPQSLNLYTYVGNNPITRFDIDGHCWPVSDCVTKFQNAIDSAHQKVANALASSENALVATAGPKLADAVASKLKAAADKFRAGEAIGACIDTCNGVQTANAVSQDLNRTAGLVLTAAGVIAMTGAGDENSGSKDGAASQGDGDDETGSSANSPTRQKSSATLRKEWSAKEGQPWPQDSETGGNQQVHHEQAKADGGSPNDVNNIRPLPRSEHQKLHQERGDFKRWGARAHTPKKPE